MLEEKEKNASSKINLIRSPLGPVRNDPNSPAVEKEVSVSWESPKSVPISPLKFDSSSEMYRHKENLHAQLQMSFSASKNALHSHSLHLKSANASGEKSSAPLYHAPSHSASHVLEVKPVPKTRATVVSARRVISTRITHQVKLRSFDYFI